MAVSNDGLALPHCHWLLRADPDVVLCAVKSPSVCVEFLDEFRLVPRVRYCSKNQKNNNPTYMCNMQTRHTHTHTLPIHCATKLKKNNNLTHKFLGDNRWPKQGAQRVVERNCTAELPHHVPRASALEFTSY